MEQKDCRWIHLSDLHFKFNNYSSKKIRKALLNKIGEDSSSNPIDFITIAGDLCFKAEHSLDETIEFLSNIAKAAKIDIDRMIIVPGNHDLSRTKLRDRILNSIHISSAPLNEVDGLDEESFKCLMQGQQPFIQIYERFLKKDYPVNSPHQITTINGLNLIHVNTCIYSGRDSEEGQLIIGQNRLYDAVCNLPKDAFNIAIGHHGIDCLCKDEQDRFISLLTNAGIDLYLCGHSHQPGFQYSSKGFSIFPSFVTGSVMADGYAKSCYLSCEINVKNSTVAVTYNSWNETDEFWYLDNSIAKGLRSGELTLKLKQNQVGALPFNVDEDDFRSFILKFNHRLSERTAPDVDTGFVKKDVSDKFEKMKCSQTVKLQFDKCSIQFPIITDLINNPNYISYEARMTVPNVIIEEYNKIYKNYNDGGEVIEAIVSNVYNIFSQATKVPPSKEKLYIKILVFWTIHECDIFNEVL